MPYTRLPPPSIACRCICGWNTDCRYKVPVTVRSRGNETILFFDLENYIGTPSRKYRPSGEESSASGSAEPPEDKRDDTGRGISADANSPRSVFSVTIPNLSLPVKKQARPIMAEPVILSFCGWRDRRESHGALAGQHHQNRAQKDLAVEKQRPVFNILTVQLHDLIEVADLASSADLPQAGNAGFG